MIQLSKEEQKAIALYDAHWPPARAAELLGKTRKKYQGFLDKARKKISINARIKELVMRGEVVRAAEIELKRRIPRYETLLSYLEGGEAGGLRVMLLSSRVKMEEINPHGIHLSSALDKIDELLREYGLKIGMTPEEIAAAEKTAAATNASVATTTPAGSTTPAAS